MRTRPRIVTSIPFWVLVVGSLAAVFGGLLMSIDKITVMQQALTDQTATGVEVYVGQAWIIVGAALLAGGIVGLVLALALAVAASLIPRADVAIETIDWTSDVETAPEAPVVAPVVEPAPATTAAPIVSEDPDVETTSDTPAPPQAAAEEGDTERR